MIASAGRLFVILGLCAAIGGHWFLLQSIAWGTMITRYSQEMPLTLAISQTFDGSHPCDLCKNILKARKKEKKQDVQLAPTKPDLICAVRSLVLLPRSRDFVFGRYDSILRARSHEPPTPPPRTQVA